MIALKLKPPKIELLLATNDETPEPETKHITDVWRILKELSHLHFHEDSPPPTFQPRNSLWSTSYIALFTSTTISSSATTREIWEGDTKIGSLLEGRNSTNEDEDSDLINKEEVLFRGPSVYSDRLNKYHDVDWDVDDDQVSGFTCLLGGIPMLANSILADGDACERWMDELNCKSEP